MQKKLIFFIASLGFLLAACGGKTPAAVDPTPTAAQPAATATIAVVDTGCTVVSIMPTPGPTEVSRFRPAGADDWVRGPADAAVTFIEYSDFQ